MSAIAIRGVFGMLTEAEINLFRFIYFESFGFKSFGMGAITKWLVLGVSTGAVMIFSWV